MSIETGLDYEGKPYGAGELKLRVLHDTRAVLRRYEEADTYRAYAYPYDKPLRWLGTAPGGLESIQDIFKSNGMVFIPMHALVVRERFPGFLQRDALINSAFSTLDEMQDYPKVVPEDGGEIKKVLELYISDHTSEVKEDPPDILDIPIFPVRSIFCPGALLIFAKHNQSTPGQYQQALEMFINVSNSLFTEAGLANIPTLPTPVAQTKGDAPPSLPRRTLFQRIFRR